MAGKEDSEGLGSTLTRTTRMIYVEEISDNEKENVEKRIQHIEMQTKVTKESLPKPTREGSPKMSREGSSKSTREGSPKPTKESSQKPKSEGSPKSTREGSPQAKASQNKATRENSTTAQYENREDPIIEEQTRVGRHKSLGITKDNNLDEVIITKEIPNKPKQSVKSAKFTDEKFPFMTGKIFSKHKPNRILPKTTEEQSVDFKQNSDATVSKKEKGKTAIDLTDRSKLNLAAEKISKLEHSDSFTKAPLLHQGSFTSKGGLSRQGSFISSGGSDVEEGTPQRPGFKRRGSRMPGMSAGMMKKLTNHGKLNAKLDGKADELKTIEDTLLYQKLKLLFNFMKVAGLFFIRQKKSHHRGIRGFFANSSPLQWYCILMNILLMANFIRSLSIFDGTEEFGSLLFFKFVVIIFFYEAVSRAILAFIACNNTTHGLPEFFMSLENVCYPDNIIPYETSLHRNIRNMLILSFMVTAANLVVLAYGFYGPASIQQMFNYYLVPMDANTEGATYLKMSLFLITFVNNMVAMLSLTFYTLVCYVLHKEFEYFSRTFCLKITPEGVYSDDLERSRIRHQKRCQVVEEADKIFKYYIANTYMTNVPLLCLLLYSVVYVDSEDNEFSVRMISLYRMLYVFLQMMVLSVVATMINTQAHSPLHKIYSIRVQEAHVERQMEITMFLNKLTGTQIGLTAWDMFVINKPTVLTVVGMIFTYFFLLVQFKNPLQGATVCNCIFTARNGRNITLPSHTLNN